MPNVGGWCGKNRTRLDTNATRKRDPALREGSDDPATTIAQRCKRNGWRRLRWVTVTAAIVFAALVMLDALAISYALAAFGNPDGGCVSRHARRRGNRSSGAARRRIRTRRRSARSRRDRPAGSGDRARSQWPGAHAQRPRARAGAGAAAGRAGVACVADAGTDRGDRAGLRDRRRAARRNIPSAFRSIAGSKPSSCRSSGSRIRAGPNWC